MELILSIDGTILRFVQESLRSPALTEIMRFMSRLGDMGMLWIVLGLVLVCIKRTRRGGIEALAGLACEFAVCDLILKPIFARTRPYIALDWLELLVSPESSFSFPSGHSASSFVCAFMLTRAFGKKGATAYIPAALIALSRIYVGVHYPSDVFCGMLLGTAVGLAVSILSRHLLPVKKTEK